MRAITRPASRAQTAAKASRCLGSQSGNFVGKRSNIIPRSAKFVATFGLLPGIWGSGRCRSDTVGLSPSRALASEPVFQFGSCVVPRGVALVGSGKVFKQPADVREFVRQFQGARAVLGGKLALLISAAPAPHNASGVV